MLFKFLSYSPLVLYVRPDCFPPLFYWGFIPESLAFPSLMQHKTIDSVLARGERLDSLVEKSSDLSAASQVHRCACGIPIIKPKYLY